MHIAMVGLGKMGASMTARLMAGGHTVVVTDLNPEATVTTLGSLLSKGDVVVDGGNSNYKDSMRRAATLAERGIRFVDVGTSGGVRGVTEGYSMMVGGDAKAVKILQKRSLPVRTRGGATSVPPVRGTSSRWCTTESSTA